MLGELPYEVIDTIKGQKLVGLRYIPLFNSYSSLQTKGAFTVLSGDFITLDQGTGLVHAAPAFGEDDHRICQLNGIMETPCPIDDAGVFTDAVSELQGMYVKDADAKVIKQLKNEDRILKHETLMHAYPMCPRSDTPLLYRAMPAWFVSVTDIKDKMLANNQKIHWVPGHIKNGRFGHWLANAKDWAISRNRVWGTPIPLWINDVTGNIHCIGSAQALEQLTQTTLTDLHREHIDHLTFSLPNEEGTYRRVDDVLDCWFESGSMPVAQMHYPFENKDLFRNGFPAKFIAEGIDQTRGWFYALTVLSSAIFDKPAFENVIVNGIVLAKDGKKMSKRLKNYTAPDALMNQYGADALRLYLINSGLVKAEEQRFDDEGVKEMVRKTLLPWLNAFKFLQTYAHADQWTKPLNPTPTNNILDEWITSRLESLKVLLHQEMNAYRLYQIVPQLLTFLDELTNVYIRLNRSRFWSEDMSEDKCAAFETLHHVLMAYTQCMAPFTPFLSEFIYQSLTQLDQKSHVKSVHLTQFPNPDESKRQIPLESAVSRLDAVLEMVRQIREKVKVKTKIPLSCLYLIHPDQDILENLKRVSSYIQDAANVKEIIYETNEAAFVSLKAMPNAPILGKRLQKKYGHFRKLINDLSHVDLVTLEERGSITLEGETFDTNDIMVQRAALDHERTGTHPSITIHLDTTLNQTLVDEGLAREIVSRIQKYRKTLSLNVSDRIELTLDTTLELQEVINKHEEYIKTETLTTRLNIGDITHKTGHFENIDGAEMHLQITKIHPS